MRKIIIFFLLVASPAFAQVTTNSYLPQSDLSTAAGRSQLEAQAMGATPDGKGNYPGWWEYRAYPCTKGPTVFITIEAAPRQLATVGSDDFTANPRAPVIAATGRSVLAPAVNGRLNMVAEMAPVIDQQTGKAQRAAPTGLSADEIIALVPYETMQSNGCFPDPGQN